MILKTVNVTNPRNILVHIPAYVVSKWKNRLHYGLEVSYDERQDRVIIKPAIPRRGQAS